MFNHVYLVIQDYGPYDGGINIKGAFLSEQDAITALGFNQGYEIRKYPIGCLVKDLVISNLAYENC